MNRKELIELAKICGKGDCPANCIYNRQPYTHDLEAYMFCMEDLIKALAEELEKSTLTITVKRKVQKNER